MGMILDAVSEFWDILTGVLNDNKSKIIRISSFGILFLGILWAAANYFRVDRISDTQRESGLESDYVYQPHESTDGSLGRIAGVAQTLSELRDGGEAIANAIANINNRPFNSEGYNDFGLEGLSSSERISHDIAAGQDELAQQPEEPQAPNITVKAVMITKKSKVAVVDAGGRTGLVIKKGDRLPNDSGRVLKIKSDGITVRFSERNFDYTVSKRTQRVKGYY